MKLVPAQFFNATRADMKFGQVPNVAPPPPGQAQALQQNAVPPKFGQQLQQDTFIKQSPPKLM